MFLKSFTPKLLGVRTILFPVQGVGINSKTLLNVWVSVYKYLQFLDLSYSTCETLPRFIGKLKHLRFFSLCGNRKIKKLLASICMFQNLQVLHLDECTELKTLPNELRNLISLRRLEITIKQSILPDTDIANLSSLEYLHVENFDKLESLFVQIKLPTLRTLLVGRCENLKTLQLGINRFPQLETLMIGYLELSNGHKDKNSILRLKFLYLISFEDLQVHYKRWGLQIAITRRCFLTDCQL